MAPFGVKHKWTSFRAQSLGLGHGVKIYSHTGRATELEVALEKKGEGSGPPLHTMASDFSWDL